MAATKIECGDFTFNPWRGCQKVASGCAHCYAETRSNRFGEDFAGQRIRLSDAGWREPLKWNEVGHGYEEATGRRLRVFCASLADVFEDWDGPIVSGGKQPVVLAKNGRASNGSNRMTMADLRRDLFALIDKTPYLDWLILTKRPENILSMWPACPGDTNGDGDCSRHCLTAKHRYRKNVWLLTSVSEQKSADRNIPLLLECRDLVPVLGISAEPLLGPIEFGNLSLLKRTGPGIDWIPVGGESGPQARPCDLAWIRSIVSQCRDADVPCFVKQLGSNCGVDRDNEIGGGIHCWLPIKHKHSKGGDIEEWSEDLRVRQFPPLASVPRV